MSRFRRSPVDSWTRKNAAPNGKSLVIVAALLLTMFAATGTMFWLRTSDTSQDPLGPVMELDHFPAPVSTALREAESRVRRFPRSAEAWGKWGMVLMAHDLPVEALTCLRQAELLDKNSRNSPRYRWPYYQGMCLSLSDPDRALIQFEKAAQFDPIPAVIRYELAERLLVVQRLDDAERQLNHPDLPPNDPRGELARARLAFLRNNLTSSKRHLEQVIKSRPDNRDARQLLSQVLLRMNDLPGAAKQAQLCQKLGSQRAVWDDPLMSEVVDLCQSPSQLLSRAQDLVNRGDLEAAAEILQRVLLLTPEQPDALLQQAYVFLQSGKRKESAHVVQRVLKLSPSNAEAHYYSGSLAMLDQQWSDAITAFTQAIQFKPDYAAAHHNLGVCLMKTGKLEPSIASLLAAIRLQPDLTASHLVLTEVFVMVGKRNEATEHFRVAKQLSPDHMQLPRLQAVLDAAFPDSSRGSGECH